jgi:hypothetical protein
MRWKKKITTIKTSTTKKARQAYGPEAIDITDDVSEYSMLRTNFLMGIDGFLFTIVPKFEAVILFFLSECQRPE